MTKMLALLATVAATAVFANPTPEAAPASEASAPVAGAAEAHREGGAAPVGAAASEDAEGKKKKKEEKKEDKKEEKK